MKTVYIKESGQVELISVEKPVRKKGEVLLKLLYGETYGSDLGSYRGAFAYFNYLGTPGHELSAEIVEADEDNEQGLRPGMTVTRNPYFNYGHCYSCRNGTVDACIDNQAMECQRDGAFQEYTTMPSERVYDGRGVDPILFAMIKPFCISYHGISWTEVGTGEKMLVIGTGTIGVLATVAAKAKGALVYISDVSEGKLRMAKAFGADDTILNDSSGNSEKAVNDIMGGSGFDIAIEAAGLPSIFQNCIDAVCFGGKVVVTGVGKKNLDFNLTLLQKKELNVFGSRNVLKKGLVELAGLVRSGGTPTEGTVINVYKLENRAKAFYDFAHDPGDMLKVVMDFIGN